MKSPVVTGIDVSKNFSEVAILTPDNNIFSRMRVNHHLVDDYHKLLNLLKKAEKEFSVKPAIVLEATGHYFKLLFHFLANNGYDVTVINPIQTDSIKNISVRKVKNDKVDARKIAMVYRLDDVSTSAIPDEEIEMLRSYCRQYETLVTQRTSCKNRLIAIVDQIMLNYSEVFSDISCPTSLAILEKYPTPKSMINAERTEVIKLLASTASRDLKWASGKYDLLLAKAKAFDELSLSTKGNVMMLSIYIKMIKTFDSLIDQMVKGLEQLIESLRPEIKENIRLLCTIPGFGLITAAIVFSEIGDVKLFSSPDKLVAYCGLDPSVMQSGEFEGSKNKISKRGSPHLRRALYLVGINSIASKNGKVKNQVLREFYLQKCLKKRKPVAQIAVTRKVATYVYAVLRDRKDFVARSPEEHANLIQQKNQKSFKVA